MKKLLILSTILAFALACQIPALSAPAPSISDLIPIETIIAGTAAAAQTQTAMFLPSPTQTATLLPLPTSTFTETPTATATVIFIIPSATEPFVPGNAGKGCELVSIVPYNPILNPSEKFDTSWTLKNTGDEIWLSTSADFQYSSGTDMHKNDIYDLPSSVPPQGTTTLTVAMVAPKNSGNYTTTWVLATKKNTYCKVSATIIVK